MGMYATKTTAENSQGLDTKWLKKHDYFCGWKNGGIKWTSGWGNESSIGFTVNTMDSPNIKFSYVIERDTENERHMDYSFDLVKVPCNLGGYRWAFRCGLYKNNQYCGRIAYSLYRPNSDYFGCRHCMDIVYDSQRQSGQRFNYLGRMFNLDKKVDELCGQIRKWHHKGYPTRKVRKLRRLESMTLPVAQMAVLEMELLSRKKGK